MHDHKDYGMGHSSHSGLLGPGNHDVSYAARYYPNTFLPYAGAVYDHKYGMEHSSHCGLLVPDNVANC